MFFKSTHFYQQPVAVLKSAVATLKQYPIIFLPFILTAFIQLLFLELLYFIPQYPNSLFSPLIRALWGEVYLHYPSNFYLLPQIFQNIQIPLSIFLGSFFTATAVCMLAKLNESESVCFKKTAREVFKQYVHIVIAALIAFLLVFILLKGYDLIYNRALLIRSTSGKFYLIKKFFVEGRTPFYFLLTVLSTTMLAYVLPLIVIDGKKVFSAIGQNFKIVMPLLGSTFLIVLIPSLIFIPVFMLKAILLKGALAAEWTFVMIVGDVLAMIIINAFIYTAITTVYLAKKEETS